MIFPDENEPQKAVPEPQAAASEQFSGGGKADSQGNFPEAIEDSRGTAHGSIRQALASCEGLPATLYEVAADAGLTPEAARELLTEMIIAGEVREQTSRVRKRFEVLYVLAADVECESRTRDLKEGR